jgi:hypothetical protein
MVLLRAGGADGAAYSMDLRIRVIKDADAGVTTEALAERYHVSVAWVNVGLIRSGGRISYAACAARRSNSAGLIWPSVACRRRWLSNTSM